MATPNGSATIAWFEWGTNAAYGQTTSPVQVGDGFGVVRVRAPISDLAPRGIYHYRLVSSNALGQVVGADRPLTTGRNLTAWGANVSGLTTDAKRFGRVVTFGSGSRHALAVIADGAVVAWGENTSSKTKVPAGLSNVVAVAGGEEHSLALRADGTVAAWGNNRQTNVPAGLRDVVVIACGRLHSLALKADGTVAGWGENNAGQLNVPVGLSNVVGLAAGRLLSLALTADGTVVGWGNDGVGQITVPAGLSNVVALAAGETFSLALRADGTVRGWGNTYPGGTEEPPDLGIVVAIAAGSAHCLALKTDGTVVGWGADSAGQTDVPLNLNNVVAIATGSSYSLALGSPSTAPCANTQPAGPVTATTASLNGMATPNSLPTTAWFEWGPDSVYGQTTAATEVGDGFNVVRVSAPLADLTPGGVYHYRLVASNQLGVAYGADRILTTGLKAAAWGSESWGNTVVPEAARNVVEIVAGHDHSLALKPDGTVVTWGQDYYGQTNVPPGLSNVITLASGWDHSLALKADGTVAAWGIYGWLWVPAYVPVDLSNAVAIASGDSHSLALKNDGTVVAWGFDHSGASGLTVVPPGLHNVVAITAGAEHSLALKDDGLVIAWGKSSFHSQVTAVPSGLSNVVAISATVWHSLALLADGTVRAWGDDGWAQSTVPAGLTSVVAVAAGQRHSLALRSDGSIVGWGDNTYGQTNAAAVLNGVAAISAGDLHCLALAANAPPLPAPRTVTGEMNRDTVVLPPCYDPNGDPLTFRIISLPSVGRVFQYTTEGRGALITAPDTLLSDPLGRVMIAPGLDEVGVPYTTFSVTANDGQYSSPPEWVTVNIVPPLIVPADAFELSTNGSFALSFTGLSNATYSVWASADLLDWTRLGSATQAAPGQFQFSDSMAKYYPYRFYRAGSP
jgi:alpha-tubulin suppressor-like RCC1 family protein